MQKRRERIERWRAERKKKEQEAMKKETQKTVPQGTVKKWSLEDDSEDDEKSDKPEKEENGKEEKVGENNETPEASEEKMEEAEEEVDPLDEYMKEVQAEVKKINKIDVTKNNQTDAPSAMKTNLVIVTGVAKSKVSKNKGELIEQNQDGLEYSSEEEQEDLKDTAANIANKQKKELAKIDHNYIHYASFRKNFYVEVPEIAKMTHEEVEAYKEELEGIRVKGKIIYLSTQMRNEK